MSQGSSLMVHWVKDPVLSLVWIGLLLAWVPSLAWELPHTMGEAKRKKKRKTRSSHCGSVGKGSDVVSLRLRIQSLALFSGLRIQHCHKLWCRSQTQLRSRVAVAVVQDCSCSSNSTPGLGTSICYRAAVKRGVR